MKNNQLRLPRIRIPAGFVLHIPHGGGGKPELRPLNNTNEPQAPDEQAQQVERLELFAKAKRLGIKDPQSPIEEWSIEHLKGAIFERTCTWMAARRAGIRGMNRRWSDHAFFVAMVKAKRFGNNKPHRP